MGNVIPQGDATMHTNSLIRRYDWSMALAIALTITLATLSGPLDSLSAAGEEPFWARQRPFTWRPTVGTTGREHWPSRSAGTDGPFATLARAQRRSRTEAKSAEKRSKPLKVFVRGGKYFLNETLVVYV